MRYLLVGNGINIQFGGMAYTSSFIMKRIKYRAQMGVYDALFEGTLARDEVLAVLDGFVVEANAIIVGEYDAYVKEKDVQEAVDDFKKRYTKPMKQPQDIMLEDWLLIIRVFFLKNFDLEESRLAATEGFKRILLDAIYNGGKIQTIFSKLDKMQKKSLKRFFNGYDAIFTLNYDDNLEGITQKPVYHMHGDFSVLSESENPEYAMGYVRTFAGETVFQESMKHCYCNALLDYSGKLKKKSIEQKDALNQVDFSKFDLEDPKLLALEAEKPLDYRSIVAKIQHPELQMAYDYHFKDFRCIEDELHIIGMSPNNDDHIFEAITSNVKISKVIFYYKSSAGIDLVKKRIGSICDCESVDELWQRMGCGRPRFNNNYPIRTATHELLSAFNALSQDEISEEKAIKEVNKYPQFEMDRLCRMVREDMLMRNPGHQPTDETGFIEQIASISEIALSEGVYPTVLFIICVMNFDRCFRKS